MYVLVYGCPILNSFTVLTFNIYSYFSQTVSFWNALLPSYSLSFLSLLYLLNYSSNTCFDLNFSLSFNFVSSKKSFAQSVPVTNVDSSQLVTVIPLNLPCRYIPLITSIVLGGSNLLWCAINTGFLLIYFWYCVLYHDLLYCKILKHTYQRLINNDNIHVLLILSIYLLSC